MGYAIVPRGLGDTLRKQGAGNLEALGRLNLAAATAALGDSEHLRQVRTTVDAERQRWNRVLDELKLFHTNARASFVFFDTVRLQSEVAAAFHERGVMVGGLFSPYATWIRITIGLPEENRLTQARLIEVLKLVPIEQSAVP